jgi:bla regulator protein BlaR1
MLEWFTETTLVTAALALIAIIASQLRSVGPTTRHALWLVVMIKLVTPPLLSWPWATSTSIGNWILSSTQDVYELRNVPLIAAGWPEQSQSRSELTAMELTVDHDSQVPSLLKGASPGSAEEQIEPSKFLPIPRRKWVKHLSLSKPSPLLWWAVSSWFVGSVLLAAGQGIRILRFRRRLLAAVPAPEWLVDELTQISKALGTTLPELLVLPDLGTPLLWCLGRPRLLLPARLVKSLALHRWRGILVHELAHLRRGDQWVSRLELVAGLIWWWNPVYWLARARLDAEAELACDAWVVWALPKDRVAYAEVLFDICALLSLSPSKPPSPALGVAGSGRFFERRLTLILHNHVPCRLSPLGLLAACLLLLFAVPSWSKAQLASACEDMLATASDAATTSELSVMYCVADDEADNDKKIVKKEEDDGDDDEADDDDEDDDNNDANDDDDDSPSRLKQKAKAKKSEQEVDVDLTALEKELKRKFGPDSDFEKKVEELGEKIGREMEAKFGPGSEFEKKMEAFGKEMEAKFGGDSEFAKKMEAFGKEMEAKFGAGSDFEKKMKDLGEDMKQKYGPGSEFAKSLKDKLEVDVKAKKKSTESKLSPEAQARLNRAEAAKRKDLTRERRIQKLEAQIRELVDEIKALKTDDSDK